MFEPHFGLRENPSRRARFALRLPEPRAPGGAGPLPLRDPEPRGLRAHHRRGRHRQDHGPLRPGQPPAAARRTSRCITNSALTRARAARGDRRRFGVEPPSSRRSRRSWPRSSIASRCTRPRRAVHPHRRRGAEPRRASCSRRSGCCRTSRTAAGSCSRSASSASPSSRRSSPRPELRQLRQRITVQYRLNPLSRRGAHALHPSPPARRRRRARALFPPDSCRAVHRLTHGIPREINIVASQAMVNAYVDGTRAGAPRARAPAVRRLLVQERAGRRGTDSRARRRCPASRLRRRRPQAPSPAARRSRRCPPPPRPPMPRPMPVPVRPAAAAGARRRAGWGPAPRQPVAAAHAAPHAPVEPVMPLPRRPPSRPRPRRRRPPVAPPVAAPAPLPAAVAPERAFTRAARPAGRRRRRAAASATGASGAPRRFPSRRRRRAGRRPPRRTPPPMPARTCAPSACASSRSPRSSPPIAIGAVVIYSTDLGDFLPEDAPAAPRRRRPPSPGAAAPAPSAPGRGTPPAAASAPAETRRPPVPAFGVQVASFRTAGTAARVLHDFEVTTGLPGEVLVRAEGDRGTASSSAVSPARTRRGAPGEELLAKSLIAEGDRHPLHAAAA